MTREEIEKQFNVKDGRIVSPGKFEGEMVYLPFFWEMFLDGAADNDDGKVISIKIEPKDREMFPELGTRQKRVRFYETDQGFVTEC